MIGRRIGRLRADRRGSITVLAAAGMAIAMAAGAFAVDLGAVYTESRRLQGVADAAALAAAGKLDGPSDAARAAITAAAWGRTITPTITTGTWTADATVPVAQRFVPGGSTPNAAKVAVAMDSPLYFGRAFGLSVIHLTRKATAVRTDLAAFSLGSRATALDLGVANLLLSKLTGSSVNLTLADYNALLNADVDLLSLVGTLGTQLHLTGATYNQILAASTTLPQIASALAATLTASGDSAAATAAQKIAAAVPATAMNLGSLVDLGPIGSQDHAASGQAVDLNTYGLTQALLQFGGVHQVELGLGNAISGLVSSTVTVALGDRMAASPWVAVTKRGDPVISTTQTRLYLDVSVGSNPALKLLGIQGVRLPLYVEMASAQARLSSLTCTGGTRSAVLQVQPSLGHVSLADVTTGGLSTMSTTPSENAATFVGVGGIKVSGSARIDLSSAGWQNVNFDGGEIDARTTKTVTASGTVPGIASSLASKLNLTVTVGSWPISASGLAALVQPLIGAAATALDPLLSSVLDALGLRIGQADVRIDAVRCGTPTLVA